MAVFPGAPPNALGFKCEINLATVWTDITQYVMLRDVATISNMGRVDESSTITPSTLTLTLRNDGRFTPKNASSPYFPGIVRNCPVRISVNTTSKTGVAYSGSRFYGEVASWPPGYDISQHDTYVTITASGIWRRISQSSVAIGSCYWRYVNLLTGTSVPAAYWSMEDGSTGTTNNGFALSEGTGTNIIPTGTPSYAADGASFPGSNALPQMNAARMAANVSAGPTPTNNVFRFALSVPAANDSSFSQFTLNTVTTLISSAATIKRVDVTLSSAGQLTINGYTSTAGGATAFTGTITTKVTGVPVIVSVEITPSGGSVNWALRIIKPGAGAVLDQVTGTRATTTITAVTQVQLNPQGRLQDTTIGQAGVWYTVPSLVTAASNIGGQAGELAADRFTRICTESNIAFTVIGSGGAAMGPQVSDTMSNVLQSIEDTDGGLLYETRDQFGLGYRTLASMQNQAAAATIAHTSGALGAALAPTYDDALIRNQWTVSNYDGYSVTAQLNSGAMSIAPPPNGVGQGYAQSKNINANTHAQVNALAQQLLLMGTVDDVRYPVVYFNFQRAAAGPFFSSVPSMRIGDFFQVSGLPAFLGGGTAKQLAWGYTERFGGNPEIWSIEFNSIPELPFETGFSPGSFTVLQGAAGGVPQGSSVGSTVNGSQIGPGSVGGQGQLATAISARAVGGITQFISAATPYNWSFAVTGTPADNSYFTCTSVQSLAIAVGDTFSNTGGLGSPFTVTSIDQGAAGLASVHFTPDATGVMSTGTVQGGKNGDTWVNTSAGNQVNQWANGVWVPIQWNAANVIAANTITASQIAAGIVIAGIVDATIITGATIIATGTSGEILAYSGTPALGNLVASVSGSAGSDSFGNNFSTGVEIQTGGLILDNQASAPSAVSGASQLYSSTAGRPRYISQVGTDAVLERSEVNVAQFTIGNTVTATALSPTLTYAANEGAQSSEFEIEIMGVLTGGLTASVQTFGFRIYMDGSNAGGGFDIGATLFSSTATNNQPFVYTVRFLVSILTTGSGGTMHIHSDGSIAATANKVTTDGADLGGDVDGVAINTTTSHTFRIMGFWGGTSTGQAGTTYRSKLARRM
jgi:hypothetical protein